MHIICIAGVVGIVRGWRKLAVGTGKLLSRSIATVERGKQNDCIHPTQNGGPIKTGKRRSSPE